VSQVPTPAGLVVNGLELFLADQDRSLALYPRLAVICGYTGRDYIAAERHIEELAAIGIPGPTAIPDLNVVDGALVTVADEIIVSGQRTSGEVEPVIFFTEDDWYLGVGSDHTDRDLEVIDMLSSKAACAKPVASTVYSSTWVQGAGDDLFVESFAAGREDHMQLESLAYYGDRDELIRLIGAKVGGRLDGVVAFCGTVPLRSNGFVFGDEYEVALCRGAGDMRISKRYRVITRGPFTRSSATAAEHSDSGGANAHR
jgi:hypothetical protein